MKKLTREQILDLRKSFEVWQQDYDSVHDKEQHDMFALGVVAMNEMLAAMDGEAAESQPVAWTDEEELRDLKSYGFCEMFSSEPVSKDADPRRVIPLYRHDRLSLAERREWMARGVDKSNELISAHSWGESEGDGIVAATDAMEIIAAKIRAGEVE
ncbi:hypothetical protein HA49_22745 [Tatumella morbirosei]|uniref:Uncharacterized protein n=1 Tax=Tatumella morbirosei TaxID=642227 RepID=A0A0F5BW19_9GAMM|nr:hypothetical protein [Tatumella morbirosei]KKA63551.1 hypothetical protein HA49_22745 [Tatumella morbirosei]